MSGVFLYFWVESSCGVVKIELYVPVKFFPRNKWFWKNIYYHNHFRFLDGNFPGLRQKISCRFISSAFNLSGENFRENHLLETNSFSLFFLDFYAFLFSVKLRRFLLAVLSELNSTFPQDCLHGKPFLWKKFFNSISLCRRKYFVVYGKTFSARLVRTAFFVCSGSFHEEKIFEKHCLYTWGNSLKVSRNST